MGVLKKIENGFIAGVMLLTVLLAFINVFLRQFGLGFSWTEELIRYLIIWMTFIGASVCVRNGSHISIDAIPALFRGKAKNIFNGFIYLISLIFSIGLLWFAYIFISDQMNTVQVSPALGFPMYYFYLVILIMAILITVQYAFLLYKTLKSLLKSDV